VPTESVTTTVTVICEPETIQANGMPKPLFTVRDERTVGRGWYHALWFPLPDGADLDAARGHLDDCCSTGVEIEDPVDGRVMMTVKAISPSQSLEDGDRGVMMGEPAEV
jgi:hypothetical protein